MEEIKFREYHNLPLSTEPLIIGRTASYWLFRHMYDISQKDFYNQLLTEQDLKNKYPKLK